MKTSIPVENGQTQVALRDFLGKLLTLGVADLLYVPMRTPSGSVTPAIVSDPAMLAYAEPLAPVMPFNGATQVGKLSIRQPRPRVAALLRSCEIRALIELTKLQQASLDDLTLVCIDCPGTYSVPIYQEKASATPGDELWQALYQQAVEHPETVNPELRQACQMCEQPVYESADIVIQLLDGSNNSEIHLTLSDELGETLELSPQENNGDKQAVHSLVEARMAQRDRVFEQTRASMGGSENLSNVFAACIRCHNCMNVCPICYCKTCIFKSEIFDHEPMQYVTWVRQKGAFRMPADTMLFHLTRLNHMGLSCVGCGMCTEACPADLPVGNVFRTIAAGLQQTFDYLPGRSLDEPLPLITFKADEWNEVGEN
jgi:formate dehydrogenase subunit beta